MQDAYDLVILLLDTGARYSEIANIKWAQIFVEKREIHLWRPKVQNEAILYMTDRVHEVLRRRAATRGSALYVFRNKKGALGVMRAEQSQEVYAGLASTTALSTPCVIPWRHG